MKTLKSRLISTTVAATMALISTCSFAAGFQHGFAADPDGKPLEIGIWYPSKEAPKPMNFGPTTMTVAMNGAVDGSALPMVVMSHGAGSSFMGHYDTAIALADAGYVVAAVTHTGDNYADKSRSVDIMDRPRHISRAIDHMLAAWDGHASINAQRIGMFGYSAGGFTTLVSIGGIADFSTIGPMCSQYPADFACQLIAKSGRPTVLFPASSFKADLRIKAALVAAPALGFSFAPDGLKGVKVPVQLWSAENDAMVPTPRYAQAVRLALPQAPDYRVVRKAGHYDFMAPCSDALAGMALAICKGDPDFDRAAFHQTFNAAAVDFFGKTLKAQ